MAFWRYRVTSVYVLQECPIPLLGYKLINCVL